MKKKVTKPQANPTEIPLSVDAPKKTAKRPQKTPTPVAKKVDRPAVKSTEFTLFAKSGREEKPVGTVSDFASIEALKSAHVFKCQQGGANPPTFRTVQRDYDDSKPRDEQVLETEVE